MFVYDPVFAGRVESVAVCPAGELLKNLWMHKPKTKEREPLVTDYVIAREKLSETMKVCTSPLPFYRAMRLADFRQLPPSDERSLLHQRLLVSTRSLHSFCPKYIADHTV